MELGIGGIFGYFLLLGAMIGTAIGLLFGLRAAKLI
jgi:Cytochrome B6-F complex subunit VI (PetL)